MLFNSYEFIFLFLPVTLLGFFLLARFGPRWAAFWLIAASLLFYGWWNPRYVGLLLASIAVNYLIGRGIARAVAGNDDGAAQRLLVLGVSVNLAALGYFKYSGFFVQNLESVTGLSISFAATVLPLGISFFTFTQIAFLVDVRRGFVKEYSPSHYMLFVTYFPHLIAGPIIHHKQMMPQFARLETYRPDAGKFALGVSAFAIGLGKKVLIADNLARFAAPVFAVAADKPVLLYEAWIGALAYTLQLYFDFSGYCDMAIGMSLLFGIKLPINFDSPYKARDISDFWRRWHISLYSWFNEYLFTPLAVARRDWGKAGVVAAIMVTFTLSGLWHGASWTFVAWGGIHGSYLSIHYWWRRQRVASLFSRHRLWAPASWTITFLCVVYAFVFFRSASFTTAIRMLDAMSNLRGARLLPEQIEPYLGSFAAALTHAGFEFRFGSVPLILQGPVWIVPLMAVVLIAPNTQEFLGAAHIALAPKIAVRRHEPRLRWHPAPYWALGLGLALALAILSLQDAGEFLYYQF